MSIYLFNTSDIIHELKADAGTSSAHNFGRNILPEMIKSGRIFAHEFIDKNRKEAKYRRDVGELDAYWEASIDKDVFIPAGIASGYNPREDRARSHVSQGGVVVIPEGAEVR